VLVGLKGVVSAEINDVAFATSTSLTVIISLLTKQQKSDDELKGLVYSLTPRTIQEDVPWYEKPVGLAIVVAVICLILSIIFW